MFFNCYCYNFKELYTLTVEMILLYILYNYRNSFYKYSHYVDDENFIKFN